MRLKRKLLTISMIFLMVFSLSQFVDSTYAYWASGISTSSNTTTRTISTGTWTFTTPYDPNTSYNIGDIVTNNGITYEAKKSGLLREPGVEGGWARDWTQLT